MSPVGALEQMQSKIPDLALPVKDRNRALAFRGSREKLGSTAMFACCNVSSFVTGDSTSCEAFWPPILTTGATTQHVQLTCTNYLGLRRLEKNMSTATLFSLLCLTRGRGQGGIGPIRPIDSGPR